MNYKQFLLGKLAEEASEVAQIALKTQQFGYSSKHTDHTITNKEEIHNEVDELQAIIEMLNDVGLDYKPNMKNIKNKKDKVLYFLEYSKQLGKVNV